MAAPREYNLIYKRAEKWDLYRLFRQNLTAYPSGPIVKPTMFEDVMTVDREQVVKKANIMTEKEGFDPGLVIRAFCVRGYSRLRRDVDLREGVYNGLDMVFDMELQDRLNKSMLMLARKEDTPCHKCLKEGGISFEELASCFPTEFKRGVEESSIFWRKEVEQRYPDQSIKHYRMHTAVRGYPIKYCFPGSLKIIARDSHTNCHLTAGILVYCAALGTLNSFRDRKLSDLEALCKFEYFSGANVVGYRNVVNLTEDEVDVLESLDLDYSKTIFETLDFYSKARILVRRPELDGWEEKLERLSLREEEDPEGDGTGGAVAN